MSMQHKHILRSGFLALVLATTSVGAMATTVATKFQQLSQSHISASDATDKAVQAVGGTPTEVAFKQHDKQTYYKVELRQNDQKTKVNVDANTGAILTKKSETKALKTPITATISLQQAMHAAENKTGGRTKEADLRNQGKDSYFEVETITATQKNEVKINAQTGAVISSQVETK